MTVLYITDRYERGGAYNSFKEMVSTLVEKYEVVPIIVASKKGKYSSFAAENGFDCIIVDFPEYYISSGTTLIRKIIRFLSRPIKGLEYCMKTKLAIDKLTEETNKVRIDLIHTNLERYDIGSILSKTKKIPHIMHIREFGERDYGCFSLRPNYISFINKTSTCCIAISHSVSDYWIDKGINPNKMRVVYNGVETRDNGKIERCNNPHLKIIMVGLISPNKGQIYAIEAIRDLSEEDRNSIHLDFYGRGAIEYVAWLKYKIRKYKLNHIIKFRGEVKCISEVINNYNVGLMCSKSEGFGRVTVEYMQAGLCVIASNTGANKEIINNNKNGLLYDYNKTQDLSDKIRYIIKNPSVMKEIREQGKKDAFNRYTKYENAKNVYKIYESIVPL